MSNNNWDILKTPPNLSPAEFDAIVTWYLSLQPDCRGNTCPPPRKLPDDRLDKKWCELKKGGPRGLFLVLMAISWAPLCIPSNHDQIEALIADVTWLLEQLVLEIVSESTHASGQKRCDMQKVCPPAKKRKVSKK
jgi:hypothetical protein